MTPHSKKTLATVVLLLGMISTLGAMPALAATLSGTVTNATTQKPAAGDDVILLRLAQGMEEAARTKTDKTGHYSFTFDDAGPHLIRVIHENVTYHQMAPPGIPTADVNVYDAAAKVDGIAATVQVVRMQVSNGQLQVNELYGVKNTSQPPKTMMADQTFRVALPEDAQIDSAQVQSGTNGMPVTASPVPDDKQKGQYYFVFPLRPGETRFQINYHRAYSGAASFTPKAMYPLEHFVVILPKAMQFQPADGGRFQATDLEAGANTAVSNAVNAGETLAFKVAGSGEFPAEGQGADDSAGGAGGAEGNRAADSRPGGGLGVPIDAPDPLNKYRWYILAALAIAMTGGAVYVMKRGPVPVAASSNGRGSALPVSTQPTRAGTAAVARAASGDFKQAHLMDALKEELFQLEVERQQQQISEEEYGRAKAALDLTIGRALKRKS